MIFSDSIFQNANISFGDICKLLLFWIDGSKQDVAMKHLELGSLNTVVNWYRKFRDVAYNAMITNKKPIGGPGKIIEIDESKFGKRKYHKGHHVEGQWVFGGIERGSGKCFLVPVEKRDRKTLIPIIEAWIEKGSIIMSDYWRAYDVLGEIGYEHLKVNHSIEFKNSKNGACTNAIEATWNAAKRSFSTSSRRKNAFAGHLARYMFLKSCKMSASDPFIEFFSSARVYLDSKKFGDLFSEELEEQEDQLNNNDEVQYDTTNETHDEEN